MLRQPSLDYSCELLSRRLTSPRSEDIPAHWGSRASWPLDVGRLAIATVRARFRLTVAWRLRARPIRRRGSCYRYGSQGDRRFDRQLTAAIVLLPLKREVSEPVPRRPQGTFVDWRMGRRQSPESTPSRWCVPRSRIQICCGQARAFRGGTEGGTPRSKAASPSRLTRIAMRKPHGYAGPNGP